MEASPLAGHTPPTTDTVDDPPSADQVHFAQHLLATLRRLPRDYVLGWTAGKLLAQLEKLPRAPHKTAGAARVLDPAAYKQAPLPLVQAVASPPQPQVARPERPIYVRDRCIGRIPKGTAPKRVAEFLATQDAACGASEIARATGLAYQTVANALHSGPFERDRIDGRTWRLRPQLSPETNGVPNARP